MNNIYYYCIGIGLLILLLSVVFDAFDNVLDSALDFDFLDIDIGDLEIDILPISMRALCLASVVFGSLGLLLSSKPLILRNVIACICAYISAVVVQTITKSLKKHQTLAANKEILYLSNSVVTNTIKENGFGSILTERLNDSSISSTAKSEDGSEIKHGTIVKVVEIKDDCVIVKPVVD